MCQRKENESITAFTMRMMRNEIIEDCAKKLEEFGYSRSAQIIRDTKED